MVSVTGGLEMVFADRTEAVRFAMAEATRRHNEDQRDITLNIEGEDGKWRSFDSNLMPLLRVGSTS
jgi:hypothetical protein